VSLRLRRFCHGRLTRVRAGTLHESNASRLGENMSAKILHVVYRCSLSRREFDETIAPAAGDLANFPGLRWKIWITDEEAGTCGGIHLFDDEASIEAYLRDVIGGMREYPFVSDVTATTFEIMEAPSLVMRAPIRDAVRL
jgi:hypothetical protein